MSVLIEKVRIKNFRSLKNIELNLSPITVLVGANNSGKTTFLKALQLAFRGDGRFVSQDDLFIGKDGKLLPKAERIITIDVKVVPSGNGEFDFIWLDAINNGIDGRRQDINGKDFFAFQTKIDFTKSNVQFERFVITDWDNAEINNSQRVTSVHLKGFPFYYIDAQRDLHEDLNYKKSNFGELVGKIDYDEAITENLEKDLITINEKAIAKSKVLKHTKETLEELNQALQTRGTGVEITPFPKKVRDLHKGIKVHFQDGGSDAFSMEYHGMGTRSWASLLALKAKINWDKKIADSKDEKPQDAFFPILALEEPEAHLHPNAQRQVYRQLSEIVGQKFISTHSPYIAGVADLEELRCFSKEEDYTQVGNLMISQLRTKELIKIKDEIINSKGELLFAKALILVEGPTEENGLPILAKKYWGHYDFEKGVCFVSCKGTNIAAMLQFVKAFKIKWFLLSDYDSDRVISDIDGYLKRIFNIQNPSHESNIVLLNDNIESYLYESGYEQELKKALKKLREPEYANEQHQKAKEAELVTQNEEIDSYSKVQLLNALEDWKGKASKIYCKLITELKDESRQIPPKIKELFEAVDSSLKASNNENIDDETTTL